MCSSTGPRERLTGERVNDGPAGHGFGNQLWLSGGDLAKRPREFFSHEPPQDR
jgi:hypothetical protein